MSANSISGRYVDFSDTYTRIDEITRWKTQSKSSKQGSGEPLDEAKAFEASLIEKEVIETCSLAYKNLIELGVSKEQARTVLPFNLNTTFVWTGSLLSFLHLWNLRLKPDAQEETRFVAQKMLDLVKETGKFDKSLAAFGF
jgi:thymidylate synthase (FAD)